MRVHVTIPPNTTASVRLPHARFESILEGKTDIQTSADIFSTLWDGENVTLEMGSGSYLFEYQVPGL